jgi:lipopolysaccharide export system protein LptA
MMTRAVIAGLAALLVTAGACGRSGGPHTAPDVTPEVDTLAERLHRDSLTRASEDSIRAAAAAPVAPPGVTTPTLTPKKESAPAPERRCVLDLLNNPLTQMQTVVDPVSKKRFTYLGRGLMGRCRGQDITITADSAESYEGTDLHILIGNVKYREPKYAIDANRVTYFRAEERLLFQENVHAVMTQDAATLDGQQLEYFRPVRGIRDRERVVATQRPKLTYIEKDSVGKDQPPITVLGNTIVGEGDSTFHASGDVRIERTDVLATGDSAMVDGARRFSRLFKKPVVESKGERPFTLKGAVIEMYGEAKQVDRVVAIDSGHAVSEGLDVVADTIDLRVANSKLNRAFAFGSSGARATTPERDIIADSLDIIMPNQKIRELRAIGKAYAESDPDTMKVITDERDWIRGDTLIARFDSVAPTDTTQPPVKDLHASGEASAFYQTAGDSSHRSKPGINYVTGRVIRLTFKDNAVETVTVTDKASGIYLAPDSTARLPAGARRPGPLITTPPVRRPPVPFLRPAPAPRHR